MLNEHVLAIVKIREEEMQKETKNEVPISELSEPKLKLTRAKTKLVGNYVCIYLTVLDLFCGLSL